MGYKILNQLSFVDFCTLFQVIIKKKKEKKQKLFVVRTVNSLSRTIILEKASTLERRREGKNERTGAFTSF